MPLEAHEIEYQEPVTLTGSLKVIETFAFPATPEAAFAGVVELTEGGSSAAQKCAAESVLRGETVPAAAKNARKSLFFRCQRPPADLLTDSGPAAPYGRASP